ncbi:MAG: indole-3-glycerol-phosphate synthase [Bacteroidales bacterium]|nr:indole-3-glycerol-phosphate synthase [Bacteroidales bacterium]
MTTDILHDIVAHKRRDLDFLLRKRVSMAEALHRSPSGIIAEFKRKSPSKGWIHADVEPEQVIPHYASGGAAALSILTNEEYFGGKPEYIPRVRSQVDLCPILRKEFVIDPYQVYESKFLGADAILLIAADLAPEEYADLLQLAHRLNLEVLLEVHDPMELEYLAAGVPDMLGVNNRSLGTFHTDVQHSFDIAEAMKETVTRLNGRQPVLVSESGISNPDVVKRLRQVGFRGFLIGECFMREPDPGQALANFIYAVEHS